MPSFQNPQAFFLLFFIPLIFILRKFKIFFKISFFLTLSNSPGHSFDYNLKPRRIISFFSNFFLILAYFFCVLSLAKPITYKTERVFTSRGNDIIFVLDVSPSMAAKDISESNKNTKKTRIQAAKESILKIIESNSGSSFGLVGMAKESAVLVPPTVDHNFFIQKLNEVQIGSLGDGTALGVGLSTAVYHLASSKAGKKAIVLITDGENNAGSIHPETAATLAAKRNISLYTLGVGTKGKSALEYIDPSTGKLISGSFSSSFDSSQLKKLSSLAGGRYFETTTLNELNLALSMISKSESTVQSYYSKITSIEYYENLLLLSLIFVIFAWILKRLYLKELF